MKTIAANANDFESIRTMDHGNCTYVDSNARGRARGSILMETVLVMPLLLLLIFGILQFALCWTARQMTVYAAFCATRAITVISPRDDRDAAADKAAKIALSWMCLLDDPQREAGITIPGWGRIDGSGSVDDRVTTTVLADGNDESRQFAAVRVTFRYPLLISAFGLDRILGTSLNRSVEKNLEMMRREAPSDFYHTLENRGVDPNEEKYATYRYRAPFMSFTETCVLPMPYSTRNFPKGGYGQTGGPR